ncbi:hypothetical protein AWC19_22640 [Mycobacterium palustre]|uniref:Uncharacterized protein n=1 Tax=Mycobacterium palustre TaxID=153971 RepID=A0A1X1YYR3_9MYCO|nr:hypothetical protein AWC19_22640 [Mycobacterium palustre]
MQGFAMERLEHFARAGRSVEPRPARRRHQLEVRRRQRRRVGDDAAERGGDQRGFQHRQGAVGMTDHV